MTRGAKEATFRSLKSYSECLAEEIIAASKGSGSGANSYAVRKKDETERVAKGNR
jgi:small subunit ribosomal protein S5e